MKVLPGDTVTIANSDISALNNAWTVRGSSSDISAGTYSPPTTTIFEFDARERSYTSDSTSSNNGITGSAIINATLNGAFKVKAGTSVSATSFVVDLTENTGASRVVDDTTYSSLTATATATHGDIYHAPLSAKMDFNANNMFFSKTGDITFDHTSTCGNTCGFIINPTNKKLTTNANHVYSTSQTGMQIQNVGGDIVLVPASGTVRIAGKLETTGGTTDAATPSGGSVTTVGSYLESTVSGGLTIHNTVSGDITMKPKTGAL